MRTRGRAVLEPDGQHFRQGCADVFPATDRFADGDRQFFGRGFLVDISRRTGAQHGNCDGVFRMHAQDEHRAPRVGPLDLLEHDQPVPARHGVIENQHVPFHIADKFERLAGIFRFADHPHVGLRGEKLLQPLPNQRVIVCNNDIHRCVTLRVRGMVGMLFTVLRCAIGLHRRQLGPARGSLRD